MTQSNESFDPSIAHKILSEVSPSELSSDYLEYTDTSYLHKNIGSTIKTGCIEYSTVSFLHDFLNIGSNQDF